MRIAAAHRRYIDIFVSIYVRFCAERVSVLFSGGDAQAKRDFDDSQ